jgi:hypothetical protein
MWGLIAPHIAKNRDANAMLLTLLIIIACCIVFAAPLNVALAMIALVFWAGIGVNEKYGCLGRIFNFIFFVLGAILLVIALCLS